jgi:4-amino-4-deoxy-L-arabinose transferase-like glycosyltransferase
MATTAGRELRSFVSLAERLAELATATRMRAVGLLIVISLAIFLPGVSSIPPMDRDEPRYAQATKQMMESGDYVDIRFQDQPRYLQPIGIYWLHVAAARITGTGAEAPMWVHRLPSLLGATLAVVLTYWVALPLAGEAAAYLAALLMASCVVLGFEAHNGKIDAMLLATILGAMGLLARAYLRKRIGLLAALAFWAVLGLGLMLKGPIIILVVGATALVLSALDRSVQWLRALRPSYGAGVTLLVVLPWLIAIWVRSGGEFFSIALGPSMLGKVTAGQQGHGMPPGTYLVLFWLTFWPAAPLTIAAAPWIWQNRRNDNVKFCLAWIVPTWLVFEAVVTKLPHYVMPVYPAIAILIGLALVAGRRPGRILQWLLLLGAVVSMLLGNGLLYAVEGRISPAAVVLSLAGVAVFAWAALNSPRLSAKALVTALAVGTVALYAAAYGVVMPQAESLWPSPRLVAAIKQHAPCPTTQVASAGYHEPSLVFLAGTETRLVVPAAAAEFLRGDDCRVVLVEKRGEPLFLSRLRELGLHAAARERVTGINIGKVQRVDIGVFVKSAP